MVLYLPTSGREYVQNIIWLQELKLKLVSFLKRSMQSMPLTLSEVQIAIKVFSE